MQVLILKRYQHKNKWQSEIDENSTRLPWPLTMFLLGGLRAGNTTIGAAMFEKVPMLFFFCFVFFFHFGSRQGFSHCLGYLKLKQTKLGTSERSLYACQFEKKKGGGEGVFHPMVYFT